MSGTTPIPYSEFFAKVGVEETESEMETGTFLKGQEPYIDGNPQTKELFFREGIAYNSFLKELEVEFFDAVDYDVFDLDMQCVDSELLQQHFACDSSYYHNFIAMPRKG